MSLHVTDPSKGKSYKILELIGEGGFGKVYRGLDVGEEDVAIKAMDISSMMASKMKERVNAEVSIHSRLVHPSIVGFRDVFQDSDNVYLILEYCPKGDLRRYLSSVDGGRISESEALGLFSKIVNGVLYLHKHWIVHRDLTLANILLTRDYEPKISDFGLATQMSGRNEVHTTMCGTPVSIAPEVIKRKPHGPEADVWGLGCILYTLLVGVGPFETEGVKNTMKRVVTENPLFPDYMSMEARDLITKTLIKDPSRRINSHEILNHPFFTSQKRTHTWDSGIISNLTCNQTGISKIHDVPPTFKSSLSASNIQRPIFRHIQRQQSWSELSTHRQIPMPCLNHKSLDDENSSGAPPSLLTNKTNIEKKKPGTESSLKLASPIKSNRLRPTSKKQTLKVGTASILTDNRIQLEFKIGKSGNIVETLTISPDGFEIEIDSNKPTFIKKNFNYSDLPKNYWQKYNYAARYVNFVKEKTPKITYYSDKAKCHLMENEPVSSFEATFYDENIRISFTNSTGIKIVKNNCECGSYVYPLSLKESDDYYERLKHFEDCHTRCKRIEDLLRTNENYIGGSVFPTIIGKKPPTVNNKGIKDDIRPATSMRSITSFKSDRTTKVDFDDETAIELGPESEIKFYKKGRVCPISENNLPSEVRLKLSLIDQHIKQLRNCKS